MTREQMIAEVERRRLIEQVEAKRSAESHEPEPESEMSGLNKARGAIQSYNKGSMLGFGDEIVGAGRTAIDSLLPNSNYDFGENMAESDRSIADDYRMYRDDERAVTEDFEKDYGKTALALNVLGGIGSPANAVGGVRAAKAGSALPRAGSMASTYGKFGRQGDMARRAAGRAVVEGGAAGLGESEATNVKDAARDIVKGAGIGLTASTALRGLGKATSKVVKRRVAQDLVDETGRRTPLHMVDEPISHGYRTVGQLPGARGKLAQLEEPFVEEAAAKVGRAADDLSSLKASNVERQATRALNATEQANAAMTNIDDIAVETAKRVENLPVEIAQREAAQFRSSAARQALPNHAQGILEDVDIVNDIPTVRQRLANYWNKDAFQEVKSASFPWANKGNRKLRQDIRTRMADDPELALALDSALGKISGATKKLRGAGIGAQPRTAQELIDMLDSNIEAIDGDALMAIRNTFATGANGNSKNGWALRQVANEFDDFIRDNLGDEAKKQFNENLNRYTTALSYMDASRTKAARENAGKFTPAQWMGASSKYGGRGMSARTPPMETVARTANEAIDSGGQTAKAAGKAARRKTKRSRAEAKSAARMEKASLTKAKRAEDLSAKDLERNGPLPQARREAKELSSRLMPKNKSILSEYLASSEAGKLVPSPIKSRPYKAIQGIGIGKMIGSDAVQDILAGQGPRQVALAKAIREGDLDMITRILSRQAALEGQENR